MSEVNNNLLNEIWKPIPDYELEYAVSNLGRVKRLKESTARRRYPAGMIIKPAKQKNGYTITRLSLGDKIKKTFYTHRLVLKTFVGPCPDKYEVNHINGIRDDNRLDNLEYVSRSDNNLHAYKKLNRKAVVPEGPKHHKFKLSDDKVREIRKLYSEELLSYAELGRRYGVDWSSIRSIIKNETHRYVK